MSTEEYRIYMVFRWWRRVITSCASVCRMVSRLFWKWSCCRWTLGALVLFLTLTALSNPARTRAIPMDLDHEDVLKLPGPSEQVAGLMDLAEGYHKRARVHLGTPCKRWFCLSRSVSSIIRRANLTYCHRAIGFQLFS